MLFTISFTSLQERVKDVADAKRMLNIVNNPPTSIDIYF